MNFEGSLSLLKSGHKVYRKGWNGSNMFIYMQSGSVVPVVNMKPAVAKHLFGEMMLECDTTIEIKPHIDMKTTDGSLSIGWVPSQADMFAEDWIDITE